MTYMPLQWFITCLITEDAKNWVLVDFICKAICQISSFVSTHLCQLCISQSGPQIV